MTSDLPPLAEPSLPPPSNHRLSPTIRLGSLLILLLSAVYVILTAMNIPKFEVIFKEVLGDTEIPTLTALALEHPTLCLVLPLVIAAAGALALLQCPRPRLAVLLAALAVVLNVIFGSLLALALEQPLQTIIVKFQPEQAP
jgi:hypothetical protein